MAFPILHPEEQLADEFRRRIRSGAWGDRVPGILRLASDFGVSRPLVEKAVARLIASGDILHRGNGRAMRPVRGRADTKREGTLIVHDHPADMASGQTMELLNLFLKAAPQPASILRLDAKRPVGKLVAALAAAPEKYLLIANLPGEVADRLTETGRKVIFLGGFTPRNACPHLARDYRLMITEPLRRAFAAGHRRVSTPLWRRTPETCVRIRAWIAEEYAAAGLRHSPEFDCPVVADERPAAMHACVRELCRVTPPTAFILHDLPHWIATMSVLGKLRLRVPEDVSIALATRWSELDSASPPPAHMSMDPPAFLPALRRLIREIESGKTPRGVLIPPVWVPGDSLAAPRPPSRTM